MEEGAAAAEPVPAKEEELEGVVVVVELEVVAVVVALVVDVLVTPNGDDVDGLRERAAGGLGERICGEAGA